MVLRIVKRNSKNQRKVLPKICFLEKSDKYGLIFENQDFVQADLDMMYKKLSNTFDEEWGGFQRSPKFPMPSIWLFLLRYAKTSPEALAHLKFTLDKIAIGGIYDQLAGRFCSLFG